MRSTPHGLDRHRNVHLTPLSDATAQLGTLRAPAYRAYIANLGVTTSLLPERFVDTVRDVGAFVDPVIEGLPGDAVWDPTTRTWRLS